MLLSPVPGSQFADDAVIMLRPIQKLEFGSMQHLQVHSLMKIVRIVQDLQKLAERISSDAGSSSTALSPQTASNRPSDFICINRALLGVQAAFTVADRHLRANLLGSIRRLQDLPQHPLLESLLVYIPAV